MQKIYKYFYQDLDASQKSLKNLLSFDISKFVSSGEVESFKSITNFLNDIFKDKELNEYGWLDKQLLNLLDFNLINQVVSNPNKQDVDLLLFDLKLVNAVVGGETNLTRYKTADIIDFINLAKKDFDYITLVYSLRQELAGNYNRDLIKAIFGYLQKVNIYKDWETKDLLVFVLLLNIIWKNFDFILPIEQEYLLKLFLYVSVLMGVPVADYLKSYIYNNTNNPVDFVVKHQVFFDAVRQNIEVIPVQADVTRVADLSDVFVGFISAKTTPDNFANNFYQSNEKVLKDILVKVLYIFDKLKQSNLAEKNYAGDENIADDFNYQQSELISWFFAKEEWGNIQKYYSSASPLVAPELFIRIFPLFIDLEKAEAISKLSEFTDFLKNNKIILEDKELIEFHESDNKFHWSQWVI